MQAEERGVEPQFFLPYGKKDKSTGWLKEQRQVRLGHGLAARHGLQQRVASLIDQSLRHPGHDLERIA